MDNVDKVFIEIDNITIGKGDRHPIHLEYEMAKAMVPIYVFHRSQGCEEKEAREKASKEMAGILKAIAIKYSQPDQQNPTTS